MSDKTEGEKLAKQVNDFIKVGAIMMGIALVGLITIIVLYVTEVIP